MTSRSSVPRPRLAILGPQQPRPNAPDAVAEVAPGSGPIVVLTAGWRGEETDDQTLRRYLGPDAAVLPLYTWFDVVMREVPALREEYRARQDALVDLRRLHRMRLNPALDALGQLTAEGKRTAEVDESLRFATEDVQRIDQQLLDGSTRVYAAHPRASAPWTEHPVVARLRERAVEALREARAVVLTGGHVAVLLNRLQFFGVDRALTELAAEGKPIVAWSAGAMVLTDRIVLFYDDPPDGPTYPELLDRGFGLVRSVVALPHARQRLRLDDRVRVSSLASRFAPATCVGLENGAWLVRSGDRWRNRGAPGSALELRPDGAVVDLDGEAR